MTDKPAILGGTPIFSSKIRLVQPTLPRLAEIEGQVEKILNTGMISNFSEYVQKFEAAASRYLNVKHSITVANGTTGLLLLLKALDLKGEVIVPSFTFAPAVHVLVWNELTPVFVDINPKTFNLNPQSIEQNITEHTSAIITVHAFGNPCNVAALQQIAEEYELMLIFDSAHALGSEYQEQKIGQFGIAEVFSLSATKIVPAGEGGVITTNVDELAQKLEWGRDYGYTKQGDCELVGLNGKMPEFNAILGLWSLKRLEQLIQHRNQIAKLFKTDLVDVPGLRFQKVEENNRSTYKDFTVIVDESKLGLNRDELSQALQAEGIETRAYFCLPVHRMKAYHRYFDKYDRKLPHTNYVSAHILSLPIYSDMNEQTAVKIVEAIKRIYLFSNEIRNHSLYSYA